MRTREGSMSTVVDVHCHVFNAADLPVKGFIHRLHLRNAALGGLLSGLADTLIQGAAPSFEADLGRLNTLLGGGGGGGGLEGLGPAPEESFEHEVDLAVAELWGTQPELLTRIGTALAEEDGAAGGLEGIGDATRTARRAVRWVKLFGRSRLDLVAELVRVSGDRLDLAVPLLVDLDSGLADRSRTTQQQQVELFEKLSRATMLGVLPGAGKARLHPFIGFDPLRELLARRTHDVETPLDLVKRAVLRYGFVGVKVYPPMGWRPSGNVADGRHTAQDAAELDRIVGDLAAWCAEQDVPITAHANNSNHADPAFDGYGGPDDWLPVLAAHPRLRLNLGHFGGAQQTEPADGWPWRMAQAMAAHPGLFADVGNHRIHDPAIRAGYAETLRSMRAGAATRSVAERVMYGSDWYMLALYPDDDLFLERYLTLFAGFGDEARDAFAGRNALTFLGFDDPQNRNAQRLLQRYERYAPANVPAWLAT
ncbi:amidohydrolase family protein [Dactylosporangium sp. NPDC049742]|uniref:amidohydrolase family protein n=1 Tax=Dactylosporangium sp. NPDC049742 TaxID=3154737 RepID=UPI003447C231